MNNRDELETLLDAVLLDSQREAAELARWDHRFAQAVSEGTTPT